MSSVLVERVLDRREVWGSCDGVCFVVARATAGMYCAKMQGSARRREQQNQNLEIYFPQQEAPLKRLKVRLQQDGRVKAFIIYRIRFLQLFKTYSYL